MYPAVIFDLDGTVVDTIELIAKSFRYASGKVLGKVLPDDILLRNVGTPLKNQMEEICESRADELVNIYKKYNHKVHDDLIKEYPKVKEVLKELKKKNIRTAIVTSKGRKLTQRALDLFGLKRYFDVIITADDIDTHKPNPEPLIEAARRLGVDKNEAVYIGDSPVDIMAGKKGGLTTIAVLWGMFSKEVLLKECPDYVIEKPEEILRVLVRGEK